ncbi:MAG TPA: hypothetical protein VG755_15825 [Nannocystaceae bacterium]|nr:hypothetical protein [Nannocystaceae bacterium]
MNATWLAHFNRTDETALRRDVIAVLNQLAIRGTFVVVDGPEQGEFAYLGLKYEPPSRPERELELMGRLERLQGMVGIPHAKDRLLVLRYRR